VPIDAQNDMSKVICVEKGELGAGMLSLKVCSVLDAADGVTIIYVVKPKWAGKV